VSLRLLSVAEAAMVVVCARAGLGTLAALDSYAERRSGKLQPDFENKTTARVTPATKLNIPTIAIVRRPNDETVFKPPAAASEDSSSGVVEDTTRLGGSAVLSGDSEFSFAGSKVCAASGGASVRSGGWILDVADNSASDLGISVGSS